MPDKIFHCKEGASNKVWQYTVDGKSVTCEWGRVGGTLQSKTFSFGSTWERDQYIEEKVSEKLKKGYSETNTSKVKEEEKLSAALGGHQYKIQDLEFVSTTQSGDRLKVTKLPNYDPEEYIFVHILQSWSKESEYLLLSKKHGHRRLDPVGAGNFYRPSNLWNETQANGVLDYLKDQIAKFTKIITTKFAAMAGRSLDDDDAVQDAVASFKKSEANSGLSDQVLSKLASMGQFASLAGRSLDL